MRKLPNESAEKIIDDVKKLLESNANEAETRFRIIDEVIFNILNWTKDDVTVEDRVTEDGKTTFSDYIVKTVSTAFIIEAKKVGVTFSSIKHDRKLKLTNSIVSGDLGNAIIQARDYCRKLSIQFAVVTNGIQWIIFPANRVDQVTFNSSYAIVFNSIEDTLNNNYDEFYDLLSREAVINSSLEHNLLGDSSDQIEERRLKNCAKKAYHSNNKNPMYPLIENHINIAFSQSIDKLDPDSFEKCYVNTPERIKFDKKINMYLSKSQHLFDTTPVRPMRKYDFNYLKQSLIKSQKDATPLAILVLGSVGAGKTTFLHYTRHISTAEMFKKVKNKLTPQWMDIDFLEYNQSQKPIEYIYECIKKYIADDEYLSDYDLCTKKAYKKDIDFFSNLPFITEDELKKEIRSLLVEDYKKTTPYVDKVIQHASKETAIFIVVDNVDQLDEKIQSNIFMECISFAQKVSIKLIISLRSTTYIEHRNSPAFNAFEFEPILIEPPKIESVLSKRFILAKNLSQGESGSFDSENGMKFHVSDISQLINLVQSSVLGTEVGSLLEVLAAGDVRNALRMTRQFIEHGYSNPGKALDIYEKTGKYTLPRHEAFRAIMLGNHSVYSEEYSLIANPFDSRLGKTSLQLIRLFILSAFSQYATNSQFEYLDGEILRDSLRKIGVGDKESLIAISDLCKYRFISTATHDTPKFSSSFFPTRLGGYIVKELISNLTFLECTMMDTFISDRDIWEKLKEFDRNIQNSSDDVVKRLEIRVEKTRCFFKYMNELYLPLQQESIKRNLPKEWRVNPIQEIESQLEDNLSKALISAEKNYG